MKARDLRLLVMHVSTRCDQTCAHCAIWKGNGKNAHQLGVAARLDLIREAHRLGARSVLFTGGEPLLCDHIETLARAAQGLGLSVQIATNGLGLSRALPWLAETVDEIYVSLEGPETVHDRVRGSGMFSRLRDSLAAVRARLGRPRLAGRSVISSRNAAVLCETVAAARALGLDSISFLAVDLATDAFGGDPREREPLRPTEADVAALRAQIARLTATFDLGGFVIEDRARLLRMAAAFLEDTALRRAPACNAPEWSSVVEADGAVRPCFFQPAAGRVGDFVSLAGVRNSEAYATALRGLGPGNANCASCVCPKHVPTGVGAVRGRVAAILARARGGRPRPGVPA